MLLRNRFVVGRRSSVPAGTTVIVDLFSFPNDASKGALDSVTYEVTPSVDGVSIEIVDALVPITGLITSLKATYSRPVRLDLGGVPLRQTAQIAARVTNSSTTDVMVSITIEGWLERGG